MEKCLISQFIDRYYENRKPIFAHIVGDSILDEDYEVKIHRISPECPNVNILSSEEDLPFRCYPGGAANVCYQLNKFNVIPRLFTFIDLEAFKIMHDKGLKYWGYIELPEKHYIPRKKRYYEKGSQVVARRDIEKPNYGLKDTSILQSKMVDLWKLFQAEPDIIIFSDYDKGVFSNGFGIKDFPAKCTTIVDPKRLPLERWENCTIFKPNAKESYELSGLKNWKDQCDFFQSKLKCKAVVITQEGDGVVGKAEDNFEYRPNININPVDIIGAGDVYASILALALVLKFSIEEAAKIAFDAATKYVQQDRDSFGPWSFSKIVKDVSFLKNRNYKLVFTNGCFDVATANHVDLFRFAKSKGDKLIVAMNSDESIKRLKGNSRPILPLKERMKIVAAMEDVDFVVSFDEDTPLNLVKEIMPDLMVKGDDYKKEDIAGFEVLGEDRIVLFPQQDGKSTTDIIAKINGFEVDIKFGEVDIKLGE